MDSPARPDAFAPPDGTLRRLRQALALAPDDVGARRDLAATLARQGRFAEARLEAEALAVRTPADPEAAFLRAWAGLGAGETEVAAHVRGRAGEAELCARLAPLAADLGRWGEAVALTGRAAELIPGQPEAVLRQALALDYDDRFEAASALLEALAGRSAGDPGLEARIRFHLAVTNLLQGRLAEGFARMEARLQVQGPRPMPLPRWDGSPLAGRSILVRAEQGYGDLFMFIRYAGLLAAQGARVLAEPFHGAEGVLATCPGVAEVVTGALTLPADTWQIELLSLPHLLGTREGAVPAPIPYLAVPAHVPSREALDRALDVPGRRLGLVWSGNPGHARTQERNLPPEVLDLLADVPGVTWFSLQKGARARPALPLVDLEPWLTDFSDTAHALSRLDGLVSVDTGIVHLAGAMGLPTWVLLAHLPDWRWGLAGTRTPWYPSLRLHRQARHWDWPPVVEGLAAELTRAASA